MKYGFVIDNRKCIGCHACTVACKSEHDVPIGVNRTWVKQTEKGTYPNTRRVFSVLRCNHCTDAPCVEICPTEALHVREDGIVDFNNDRCIGCKSCMQACPYDALYIDPETNTAAKCNYCAHRVDVGLEPACVNVCPEHAIISGDMDDPESEISQTLSRQQVSQRKPEKSTKPNVYYIDGDEASLNPSLTERNESYLWNSQSSGVGHYAKYAQSKISTADTGQMQSILSGPDKLATYAGDNGTKKSVQVLMEQSATKRVYDTPDKGILWGWEVNAYILTKAIAAGAILVPFLGWIFNIETTSSIMINSSIIALVFLAATGLLLIKDLDRPDRFAYVILRPQWNSWLVRGGYAITIFGGLVTLYLVSVWFGWDALIPFSFAASALFGVLVAIYTAFLFAQSKGRDFWQSPMLVIHMGVHSLMAGSAALFLLSVFMDVPGEWHEFLIGLLTISLALNIVATLIELSVSHPTEDAKRVAKMIISGRYATLFWVGVLFFGNIVPIILIYSGIMFSAELASVLTIIGIYLIEKVWVEAPQRIPLT